MPGSDLPRWARAIGNVLAVSKYVLCLLVAIADAGAPAETIGGALPSWQIAFSAGGMALLGSVGLVGVIAHRWRMEWVAASALAFLLLARAVPVWATVPDMPSRMAAAAMMTLAAVGLGRRALDMWIFAIKTGAVARRRRRRLREAA